MAPIAATPATRYRRKLSLLLILHYMWLVFKIFHVQLEAIHGM